MFLNADNLKKLQIAVSYLSVTASYFLHIVLIYIRMFLFELQCQL
jgi:hypothetical protein